MAFFCHPHTLWFFENRTRKKLTLFSTAIDAVTSWDDIEERTKPIKARHVLNGIVKKKHGVARFDLVTQRALKNC